MSPLKTLGTYKTKIDALRVGSGSRRSYGKEGDYEQSNQYMSRDTKDNFHKQIIQKKLTVGVLLPCHSSGKALFKDIGPFFSYQNLRISPGQTGNEIVYTDSCGPLLIPL